MKNTIQKIISMLLAVVLCLTVIPFAEITANAAASWPSLSDSAYCEFTATKTINVYSDSSFSRRGTSNPKKNYNAYIASGDKCFISQISSSYIIVKYPAGSTYKTGYIRRSDVIGCSSPTNCLTAAGKATVYVRPGGSSYGYTEKGDTVYTCGKEGNYTLIIYTAKSGNRAYKMGYVTNDALEKTVSSASNTSAQQIRLNVPLFKQNDSRWANTYIGNKTIGQVGCTTTCISMVYSYNKNTTVYPNKMVSMLSYSNNDLYWSSISKVGLTSTAYNCGISNNIMKTIYQKLKEGRPVIIGAQTSSGGSQHWVVITGYTGKSTSSFSTSDFTINDPGTQGSSTLAAFLANGSKATRTVIIRIMY